MDVLITEPFWSVIFLTLGMVLVLMEIFIPSFGILGLCAAIAASIGIWGFFHQGRPGWATGGLLLLLAFIVVVLRYASRRLRLSSALTSEPQTTTMDLGMASLIGKEGVCLTTLRPAGLARIDGQRVDVVATGRYIEKHRRVRVVDVTGNRVVVRELPPAAEGTDGRPNGAREEECPP